MFSVFKDVILDVRIQNSYRGVGFLHLKSRFTIFTALAAIQEIPEWLFALKKLKLHEIHYIVFEFLHLKLRIFGNF